MSGYMFGYHNWERGAPDLNQSEVKDAAVHPTVDSMGPPHTHNKESYRPKCQYCQGLKIRSDLVILTSGAFENVKSNRHHFGGYSN